MANFKKSINRDPEWLAEVRKMPCVVTGKSPVEAAHIRHGCYSMGMKPPDDCVLPLSPLQHALQHSVGEKEFWLSVMRKDPDFMLECVKAFARQLYREHGHADDQ